MSKIAELRSKSQDELKEMAVTLRKELFNLRFQAASGEAVPIARFSAARKDIARIQTMLNDPQQKAVGTAAPAKRPAAKKAAAATETKAKKPATKKKA